MGSGSQPWKGQRIKRPPREPRQPRERSEARAIEYSEAELARMAQEHEDYEMYISEGYAQTLEARYAEDEETIAAGRIAEANFKAQDDERAWEGKCERLTKEAESESQRQQWGHERALEEEEEKLWQGWEKMRDVGTYWWERVLYRG